LRGLTATSSLRLARDGCLAASVRPTNGPWTLYGCVKNVNNVTALTSMIISSPVLGAARTVSDNAPRHLGVGFSCDF
jgi:hypothetical protein